MARYGYCSGCRGYVELGADRTCPAGHPLSAIRDVRNELPSTMASGAADADLSACGSPRGGASVAGERDGLSHGGETAAAALGWVVVLVPAIALLVVGTWLSVPQFESAGMSTAMSWVAAAASWMLTIAAALAWGYVRHKRRNR